MNTTSGGILEKLYCSGCFFLSCVVRSAAGLLFKCVYGYAATFQNYYNRLNFDNANGLQYFWEPIIELISWFQMNRKFAMKHVNKCWILNVPVISTVHKTVVMILNAICWIPVLVSVVIDSISERSKSGQIENLTTFRIQATNRSEIWLKI